MCSIWQKKQTNKKDKTKNKEKRHTLFCKRKSPESPKHREEKVRARLEERKEGKMEGWKARRKEGRQEARKERRYEGSNVTRNEALRLDVFKLPQSTLLFFFFLHFDN